MKCHAQNIVIVKLYQTYYTPKIKYLRYNKER